MNIFILDEDPSTAAKMHCDKHVVKMILETAQMLSTAHRLINGDERADQMGLYKAAYPNHPCTVWVREYRDAYRWAFSLFRGLCDEYNIRYKKGHAAQRLLPYLSCTPSIVHLGTFRLEEAPQAMPEQYKVDGDPIAAYRKYYLTEKRRFAVWKHSTPPEWWD